MIRVQSLQYRRGEDLLFDNLSFVVHPGQRLAVAGRNGAGKSTLFHLLLGQLHPEDGDLSVPSGWRMAQMQQETKVTDRPALAFAIDGHRQLREVERAIETELDPNKLANLHTLYSDLEGYEAEAKAGEILNGLGFPSAEFDKPYSAFSGGWRIRLNLARALMQPAELLLLDEPTNHLDLEAIVWLENWLQRFPGTVLLIAHDRTFLDACTDHTLYLTGGSGQLFKGNYSSAERQRAERLELELSAQAKRDAQAAHIQSFVDRFRAKASKAKQVQSRIKALERMQTNAVIHTESPYSINFQDPDKASNPLFSIRDVQLGYNEQAVLNKVGLTILPGDRIGVLGENGAGKSTLLKALVGDLAPMKGDLNRGQHCDIGYFAQHQLESLAAKNTALNTFKTHKPLWREQQSRDYLGGWGFDSNMISRPIETLSGGEKARLVLALLASDQPAILVLDEPTNHLDLDIRDALALALQDFSGAVIIVSHDRALLEKTIDDFWLVSDGQVRPFDGDLDDYTSITKLKKVVSKPGGQITQDNIDSPAQDVNNLDSAQLDNATSRKNQRQERARQRQALQSLRTQVRNLEKELDKANETLQGLEATLADSETYQTMPTQELDALLERAGRYRAKVESIEEQWLLASSDLESAQAAQ